MADRTVIHEQIGPIHHVFLMHSLKRGVLKRKKTLVSHFILEFLKLCNFVFVSCNNIPGKLPAVVQALEGLNEPNIGEHLAFP